MLQPIDETTCDGIKKEMTYDPSFDETMLIGLLPMK
jgi:hypothetical protein